MVLDALEQIRQAEEQVQQMKKDVQQEMTDFEMKKNQEILQLQKSSQEKVKKLLQETEHFQQEQLKTEKDILLKDAEEQKKSFQSKYDGNKNQMIEYIVERVNELYGSQ
ncbi:hypothetical protein [Enterococcus sp. BWR-S5]|uniref:hypothetical protein n=1 Tax=Enterococcus sp. BWR-S5 TaxID=2787714 RepID=UPI00192149A2|nr:hypothetical protein [Enterococcus sp. BWR-S5]MBL1226972.1 hypothetical protein [Enterococcus sp. BWR-S5]